MYFVSLALAFVVALLLAIMVGKWLRKKDEALTARRQKIGRFAKITADYGLPVTTEVAIDYSTGAYLDAFDTAERFMEDTLKDESTLTKELDTVFENMLNKKLATGAGLAFVNAKIAALSAPPTSAPIAGFAAAAK